MMRAKERERDRQKEIEGERVLQTRRPMFPWLQLRVKKGTGKKKIQSENESACGNQKRAKEWIKNWAKKSTKKPKKLRLLLLLLLVVMVLKSLRLKHVSPICLSFLPNS